VTERSEHFSALEFDVILERVSELACSDSGRELIGKLSPISNLEDLEEELGRVTEMKDVLVYDDPFPLQGFSDIRAILKRASVKGAFIGHEDFRELKRFLSVVRKIKDYLSSRAEKYPRLMKIGKGIVAIPELEKQIERVVDRSGNIRDGASRELSNIRKELERKVTGVRRRLDSILKEMISKGYAREENLVIRDGRFVIPLKESSRSRLNGIIVDQSSTGVTLFVEPLEVVELNNTIRQIKIGEKREIERILTVLTDRVRENSLDIKRDFEIYALIDSIAARAKFSVKIDGNAARTSTDETIDLVEARHPILVLSKKGEGVVPLDLRFGRDLKIIIITGPNAGGKTVALKTVGILSLMHQHGMHVSASKNSSIPIFLNVFADIGDKQSIQQDLSTFSSHIKNIRSILDEADRRSLVLLDEIGSATDPVEGAALAVSILRELKRRGCLTLCTTHMGSLKVFAHEELGVENGSMAFDPKSLMPSYRFQLGIPGASYGFEISERLGLSAKLIREAKELVGEQRGKLDRLILHLEEELQRTHRLLHEAEIKETKLAGLVKLYKDKIDRIREEGRKEKEKMLLEAEQVLKEANVIAERVIKEIRESRAAKQSIRRAKDEIGEKRERILSLKKKISRSEDSFGPGDWVEWNGHSGKGVVISHPDKNGRLYVEWEGVKLHIHKGELRRCLPPAKKRPSVNITTYSVDQEVQDEINVRGLRAEEALSKVERFIDRALIVGLNHIRIIHGKGTGTLRELIGKFLDDHPMVKTYRLGNWNEGNAGVTVVELK